MSLLAGQRKTRASCPRNSSATPRLPHPHHGLRCEEYGCPAPPPLRPQGCGRQSRGSAQRHGVFSGWPAPRCSHFQGTDGGADSVASRTGGRVPAPGRSNMSLAQTAGE